MGIGTVAATLVVLLALVSAGTVLGGVAADQATHVVEAQDQALQRLQQSATEEPALLTASYNGTTGNLATTWSNAGAAVMRLDRVTLLVDGVVVGHAHAATFQVAGHGASNLWGPGEVLDVTLVGYGNANVTVVGPTGRAAYRRA